MSSTRPSLVLHRPVRIRNQLSSQGNHVSLAFADDLFGENRIVNRRHDDRNFHNALEVFPVLDHGVGVLREEILPGLIGAG